jgi:hypothetical protein
MRISRNFISYRTFLERHKAFALNLFLLGVADESKVITFEEKL